MKYLLTLLVSFYILHADTVSSMAEELHYFTSFSQALNQAQDKNKTLMMVSVSNYCPWCRKFEHTTLKNVTINAIIINDYIPLLINKESANYPKGFEVPGVPSVFFINPFDKSIIWRSFGYKDTKSFIKELEKVQIILKINP